ncbi:hypothetical protein CLV98_105174 [Dyadobacter jejuensis]|uniref:Uncharacterized protein n=1 Tax=Dyadobacter jejuensis TaxID=1082580 RepID=A0A316ALQ6_9BACT|nr:hypothetical protein CLV98_105174 [Dyadobacter jejuensis]
MYPKRKILDITNNYPLPNRKVPVKQVCTIASFYAGPINLPGTEL